MLDFQMLADYFVFFAPHEKSRGFRSGDRGGQGIFTHVPNQIH